jgi:hypothetical protein
MPKGEYTRQIRKMENLSDKYVRYRSPFCEEFLEPTLGEEQLDTFT